MDVAQLVLLNSDFFGTQVQILFIQLAEMVSKLQMKLVTMEILMLMMGAQFYVSLKSMEFAIQE